jgi:thiol-disulfide isomerase/thioredoxin
VGCGREPVASRISENAGTTEFSTFDRVTMPNISGTTLDGKQLSLDAYRGKVVVLNNWASWCLPCNDEAPVLVAAANKSNENDVTFVGLDVSDQDTSAQEFVDLYNVPYPSIVDRKGVKLPSEPGVPPGALPSTLIIDRDGNVAVRIVGSVKEPEFTRLINSVIAE